MSASLGGVLNVVRGGDAAILVNRKTCLSLVLVEPEAVREYQN